MDIAGNLARLVGLAAVALPLTACSDMSTTQQRALGGTAGGAAGGAVIGAIAGNTGMGLAIGAATGLAGGLLYDYHKESSYQPLPGHETFLSPAWRRASM
jgi:hypothetical protein